jgi:hypothetical protein
MKLGSNASLAFRLSSFGTTLRNYTIASTVRGLITLTSKFLLNFLSSILTFISFSSLSFTFASSSNIFYSFVFLTNPIGFAELLTGVLSLFSSFCYSSPVTGLSKPVYESALDRFLSSLGYLYEARLLICERPLTLTFLGTLTLPVVYLGISGCERMCGRMFSRCSPSERLAYPRMQTRISAFLKSSRPSEFTPKPISSYSF